MSGMEGIKKKIEFAMSKDRRITLGQKGESGITKVLDPAFSSFFFKFPRKLQNCLKVSHGFLYGHSLNLKAMINHVVFTLSFER